MTWLEFISSLISALVWPVAVLAIALVLREPLKGLVPLLHRMKYKDFEMEFGRRLAEVREEAGVENEISTEAAPTPEEIRIIELAKVSPRAAVTEAWRWVELASLDAAKLLPGEHFQNKTLTFQAIRKLEQSERIDRGAVLLLRDLRGLRNDAVHSPEFAVSSKAALEYAQMARQLVGYLQGVSGA
uniref:DUF4145 domain-containing protein n=1 Tax=Candidatus Kentrum sp. DK TaxID=2126562 RepID=A0A450S193_9GAMM|nr:MAG: hypothetical protein BECKDK2373C_GA0170839_101112 [Candidatus Kentron sp. DK]